MGWWSVSKRRPSTGKGQVISISPGPARHTDSLVVEWVRQINSSPRAPFEGTELPRSLRSAEAGDSAGGETAWSILESGSIDWIASLEAQLPAPFPPSYRALVTRFRFPAFEIPGMTLFGNAPDAIDPGWYHPTAIFRDKDLSSDLLAHGLIQFGRDEFGGYDPVCFDTARPDEYGEYPVVQVDHESILSRYQLEVTREIAPSFAGLLKAHL